MKIVVIDKHLIDTLIIATHLSVETKALLALGSSGIFVICIDNRQHALLIHSHQAHNGDLKLSQYKAATNPLPLAKMILTEKIMRHIRQIALHDTLLDSKALLHKIEQSEDIATLLGIEGAFSRDYFGRYFALFPPSSKKGKGVYLRYEKRAELWREFRAFYAANEAEIERIIQKIRGML